MAYLFDTDALSEVMRKKPLVPYLIWLRRIPREEQFTSAVRADLERVGALPGDADLQIAATALRHDLSLVTGNLRHHERVPGLKIERILAQARAAR